MSDELRALHVRMDLEGDLCQGCANEAMDFYAPWPCSVIETLDALADAEERIEHLQKRVEVLVMVSGEEIDWTARLGVIRALHPPRGAWGGRQVCAGCAEADGDEHDWPCPTMKALDGEQAAEIWQDAEDLRIGKLISAGMVLRIRQDSEFRDLGRLARAAVGR